MGGSAPPGVAPGYSPGSSFVKDKNVLRVATRVRNSVSTMNCSRLRDAGSTPGTTKETDSTRRVVEGRSFVHVKIER